MGHQTIFTDTSRLSVGNRFKCRGDVTQLLSLINVYPEELERRIGYKAGRLRLGWYLLVLSESVSPGQFTWGDTTASSGGTDPNRTEEFNGQHYRIPVQDLKRADLYRDSGYDEGAAQAGLDSFLARQLDWLNDRSGPNRIVKVMPTIGHDASLFWLDQYPDVAPGHGVRQWTLTQPKEFLVSCFVPAGHRLLGGGIPGA